MVHFPTMKARVLRVWTPPGYRKPSAHEPKYPVLYLNDGQNLFEDQLCFSGVSWKAGLTAAALINSGSIPPFLIVGIDHSEGNRSYDYCPYAPGTGVSDFRPEAKSWPGGGVDAYLKGVVEEVNFL
jgi:predicted alpha/beta superfamily hydrolase